MQECDQPLHPRAAEGLRLFNHGRYFEAHEALEEAWLDEPGEIRDLYRGILQAAVVYLHITRRNYAGALKVYQRSRKWLEKWPAVCRGIQVARLRADLSEAIDEVGAMSAQTAPPADAFTLRPVRWSESRSGTKNDFVCDRCGSVMYEKNCRVICPNCGNFFDCSDLTLQYD